MTTAYEPPGEFKAENGATFRYSKREDGGVQVAILNERDVLLAGFALTPRQIIELFYELDFCEGCGEPLVPGDKHGPGHCCDPDNPGA